MIHARQAPIGHPVFFRLLPCRTQSNVGFIRAHVHPAASVATLAFAAHPEFRKCSLQESNHPTDVVYSEIRMFEPNSHCLPPTRSKASWRPAKIAMANLNDGRSAQDAATVASAERRLRVMPKAEPRTSCCGNRLLHSYRIAPANCT